MLEECYLRIAFFYKYLTHLQPKKITQTFQGNALNLHLGQHHFKIEFPVLFLR